jgi:amidase
MNMMTHKDTEAAALPDATEIAAMIRRKDVTAVEVVDDAIARAEAVQGDLNFMVSRTFERAREKAKAGDLTGPFAGVPYLIKDMFDVVGSVTRYGTRATAGLPPATHQGPMMSALESAGLLFIGRSALGEFGFLPTTEPLAFGPTRNPWDTSRTPGGSSGGAAAAVAAGVVPMADAADGGGSIRIPASACGLFGLKPSRGRMVGEQPLAGGMDLTVEHGITRSVRDSAMLFALTERTGADAVLPPVGSVKSPSAARLRVGVLYNSLGNREPVAEVKAGVAATSALLEALGHRVEETVWPFDTLAFSDAFFKIWCGAALGVTDIIKGVLGHAPDSSILEPYTLAMADLASGLSPETRATARNTLTDTSASYDRWFDQYDVILSPVLLREPVLIGEITGELSLEAMLEQLSSFVDYTQVHNVAGAPAMTVPLHWTTSGLPVGMQFAARVGGERRLFELAYELEEARPWAHRRPPVFAA